MNTFMACPPVPKCLPQIDVDTAAEFRVRAVKVGNPGIGLNRAALEDLWGGRGHLTAVEMLALPIPAQNRRLLVLRPEVIPAKLLFIFALDIAERAYAGAREWALFDRSSMVAKALSARRKWMLGRISDDQLGREIAAARRELDATPLRVANQVAPIVGVEPATYRDTHDQIPWTPWLDPAVVAQVAADAALQDAWHRGAHAIETTWQFCDLLHLLGEPDAPLAPVQAELFGAPV
jgi:hypothetical protein